MASKSTLPLVLAAGAGALLLMGGKKKKTSWVAAPTHVPGMLIMDSECSEILNKLNEGDADMWLTNRYNELVDGGMSDLDQITLQILKDQSNHCPWDTPSKWTPFMKALRDQFAEAINEFHHTKGGPVRV